MNNKHGWTGTRLYRIWGNMKSRCNNPKATRFRLWGGNGIRVCPEWDDFTKFKDWALSNGYTDDLTLDRIDGAKDYCPENCRWCSYKEQSNNLSKNHKYTFRGETLNSTQLAHKYGLKRTTFEQRMKRGWSLEKALLTKVGE